jgi:2-keto-4-pentenoate hydratase
MDIELAAQALWDGIQRKQHLPVEWRGRLSMAEAYAVQLAILRRTLAAGEVQAGWKVGLTSAAMRAQQHVAEPCFGFLLRSGHLRSGARLALDELIAPGIENELCLTIGERLAGPDATFDRARRSIAFVEPALEVAEVRGDFSADIPLSMADNAQQKAFVTGAARPYDSREPLNHAEVTVNFNNEQLAFATGEEVMGSPVNSVVWLANKLSEYGLALEPGMRVMSGSFTRQFAVARGDTVVSIFRPFGEVSASFY